ncbi:MAG: Glycogen phosphorylase [Chlamydiae bacterium]|nr:Glycogen phosphorylase [Chlamydiota bacterium]
MADAKQNDLNNAIDRLEVKIKHYLITLLGKVESKASFEEFYRAFCLSLREDILMNASASEYTRIKHDQRTLYYLSLEYLPGRFITNNIFNLKAFEIVKGVCNRMNRNVSKLLNLEIDAGLGNGGLGRLASCFLDSFATLEYPAKGYGLRYQYGIFEQQIWEGVQVETPDLWLLNLYPWEKRDDGESLTVQFGKETAEDEKTSVEELWKLGQREEVRVLPFDIPIVGYRKDSYNPVIQLRLWSTKESPKNFKLQRYNAGQLDQAAENTSLTNVLYPNDNHEMGKRIRLKQEYLLVSASLQDILRSHLLSHNNDLSTFHDKVRIQLNETHPALTTVELMYQLTENYQFSWENAFECTKEICSYTNHTVLKEALEEWNQHRVYSMLPLQYRIIEKINQQLVDDIRAKYNNDAEKVQRMSILENGQIKMAHLAIYMSHKVNGVSYLHTEILKNRNFKDFYDMFPERFVNCTNGVTHRRWLLHANPELAQFITKHIGDEWITNFEEIKKIKNIASNPDAQKEFLEIKAKRKQLLIDYIIENCTHRDAFGNVLPDDKHLDPVAIFDIQTKRIHEYKRQLMNVLHLIILYKRFLKDPNSRHKRVAIFGGKAAPGYWAAKNIIRLINGVGKTINNDTRLNHMLKVIFIENYNVSRAEMIIPAADLSEQISLTGQEASGTGNMKFSINGALTIGTDDGANVEMRQSVSDEWWPFKFGMDLKQVEELEKSGSYNPKEIYEKDPEIKEALDSLVDNTFAQNDTEREIFQSIYHRLLEEGPKPDHYFILKDLRSYIETHEKAEELFKDRNKWAEYCINNIAGMGPFSIDHTTKQYIEQIWGIEKCPMDKEVYNKVLQDFTAQDRCRIY